MGRRDRSRRDLGARDPGSRNRGSRERDGRAGGYRRSEAGHDGYGDGDYRREGYRRDPYGYDGHPGDGYSHDGYRGDGDGGDRRYRRERDEGHRDGGYRTGTATRERARRGPAAHARAARSDPTGGAEGNERLTGMTGAVLLVLFAAEGFTILAIRQLLTLHFFFGMLLVGPVILKASSTIYRFVRYYTGAPEYKRKGPPAPLLRLLGPFVLLLSLSVIGTGIMLAIVGPNAVGLWLFLHKATFVLWFGAMTIHVLAYVWRLPALVGGDLSSRWGHRAHEVLGGRRARWLLLLAAVLTGLLLALLSYGRAHAWIGLYGITG